MGENSGDKLKKATQTAAITGTGLAAGADLISRVSEATQAVVPYENMVKAVTDNAQIITTLVTSQFPKETALLNAQGEFGAMIFAGITFAALAAWADTHRRDRGGVSELIISTFEVVRTPFLVAMPYLADLVIKGQIDPSKPEGMVQFALAALSGVVSVFELRHAFAIYKQTLLHPKIEENLPSVAVQPRRPSPVVADQPTVSAVLEEKHAQETPPTPQERSAQEEPESDQVVLTELPRLSRPSRPITISVDKNGKVREEFSAETEARMRRDDALRRLYETIMDDFE